MKKLIVAASLAALMSLTACVETPEEDTEVVVQPTATATTGGQAETECPDVNTLKSSEEC